MTNVSRSRHEPRRRVFVALVPSLAVVLVSGGVALFGHRSPTRLTLDLAWAPPSFARPFGSGDAGVDVLGLVSHATLRATGLAVAVSAFGFAVGTPLGTFGALRGGVWERWTLRVADLVQSFPTFLLALAVLSAVRVPSRWHIGLVFAIGSWAPFARLALVQARAIASAPFVEAARALGASRSRVVFGHVLPNVLAPVAVQLGTAAAGVVLGETALGFVGLGPPDGVSLGALLEQGTAGMLRAPHVLVAGALSVMVVSGSLQMASEGIPSLGDEGGVSMLGLAPLPRSLEAALRDAHDPKAAVRRSAVEDLGRHAATPESGRAVTALIHVLASDVSAEVRGGAAIALADAKAADALGALVSAVEDTHLHVRQMAVIALGEVARAGDSAAVKAVETALRDDAAALRYQALIASARLEIPRVEEALLAGTHDEDAEVRHVSFRLLEERATTDDKKPGDAILAAARTSLGDDVLRVRLAAAVLLGCVGERSGAPVLVERHRPLPGRHGSGRRTNGHRARW